MMSKRSFGPCGLWVGSLWIHFVCHIAVKLSTHIKIIGLFMLLPDQEQQTPVYLKFYKIILKDNPDNKKMS